MNPNQLLAHFDRISDASDAVPRLRRFILDLAVRGKLVEQDSDDEPAAELVNRVQAKKELLVENGECRPQKQLPEVNDCDAPYPCPDSWQWARLGLVANITQGFAFPSESFSNDKSDGLPLIKIGNIGLDDSDVFIRGEYDSAHVVDCGDLLLGLSGSIKCATWKGPKALLNQRIARIVTVPSGLNPQWLHLCVEKCIEIWINETSKLTVQNVKARQLYEALVPVPPLAEQRRIIAKVDELMALCDRLEAAQRERDERRDRLNRASLHRLNNGADAGAFRDHARFHLHHLPRLTTRPEHIQQLRQTILNLAVRGNLVPQDPTDEPASTLLSKLASFKLRNQEGGGGRKIKSSQIVESKMTHALPTSWQWANVETVALRVNDGNYGESYPKKSELLDSGIPFLTSASILPDGSIDRAKMKFISPEKHAELVKAQIVPGDVIFPNRGARGGQLSGTEPLAIIVPDWLTTGNINPQLTRVRVDHRFIVNGFLCFIFRSSQFLAQINSVSGGTALAFINLTRTKQFTVPVPPLAEQHRIVARVDELMKLCDQLESQLTTTQTESRRLLEAILHEALAPAETVSQ